MSTFSEVQKSEATCFILFFAGEGGGQKNGIHLYILHQASWRPQCVSTAALGVPLSLKGQLCSHEAPANCKMEKPKGTKFRMSDALGEKNKLLLDSVDSPLLPSCRRVFLLLCMGGFQIWSISIHGLH